LFEIKKQTLLPGIGLNRKSVEKNFFFVFEIKKQTLLPGIGLLIGNL
jgi:hypothetical protein